VLERVLSAAAWAPSGSNIQPWNTYVLTGAPLAELKTRAVERRKNRIAPQAGNHMAQRRGLRGALWPSPGETLGRGPKVHRRPLSDLTITAPA
jgi:nitroreductase